MEVNNIFEPTIDFDFSNLCLTPPTSLSGGAYFTKILLNNKPLYFQTPKCISKQGFVKSGKKIFIDLMFDNNDSVFINWMEKLELKCQDLLFEKKELWFQNNIEKDDIESTFTSPLKIYKSAKFYLLRANVKPQIKIFNECQQVLSLDDVSSENYLISIVEIQGIKFSSRNFQMEVELKQSMVVSPDPFLDSCFIKNTSMIIKNKDIENKDSFQTKKVIQDNDIDLEKFVQETTNELIQQQNSVSSDNFSHIFNDKLNDKYKTLEKTKNVNFKINNEVSKINNTELMINDINEIYNNDIINDINKLPKNNVVELNEVDITDLYNESENDNENLEKLILKSPNDVYYEIYKKAKDKAKEAKKLAIEAYIEAKNIKDTYMIEDSLDSDTELDMDNFNL